MKMWLLSILLPGLLLTTNACSPTDESVKTEEPTPVPDLEPNGNKDDGSVETNQKKRLNINRRVSILEAS